MICPQCGARLADGTPSCPICGADLGVTNKIPRMTGTYCPSCGALIPEGADACPKCGMPSPSAKTARPVRDIKLPKVSDSDSTSEFTAIQLPEEEDEAVFEARSAIPPERPASDEVTLGYDRMAHVRVMAIAAIAALFVMGGLIIFITHPFDPGKYDQRAVEEADTSTAGSPGQIDALSGQDTKSVSGGSASYDASEAVFDLLHETYEEYGDLAVRLDEQEAYFLDNYLLEDEAAREAGLEAAHYLSIDVSNAIDAVQQLGASETYGEDIDNLIELGNWLRNRCDSLVDAWEVDLGYLAPAMVQDIIDDIYYEDKDSEGTSVYKTMFEENYEDWEPVKR